MIHANPGNINISAVSEVDIETLPDHFNVMLNLSSMVPEFSHKFSRIAEIVENEETAKVLARQRFKFYKDQGFELKTHSIEL